MKFASPFLRQTSQFIKQRLKPTKHRKTLGYLAGVALTSFAAFGTVMAPAQAQTRNYTPRLKVQARGRTTIFGNAVTTCSTAPGAFNSANCAAARNATVTPATANNDFFIDYIDIDGDASTFNSSSSTYTFPSANSGFNIVWAGLYWTGDTSAGGQGGSTAPSAASRSQMSFKVPGGIYQTVLAEQLDTSGTAASTRYSAFADVTTLVRQGGSGEYFGANIQTGKGTDRYGGWTLIVVYEDDTEVLRNMTIFDGYLPVSGTDRTATISGFLTPQAGPFEAAMGAFISEGDVRFQPDEFQINNQVVSDANNPSNNFFNSSNSLYGIGIKTNTSVITTPGGPVLGPISRNPDYSNLLALDIDIVEALDTSGDPIIPNGATSADLKFTTTGDVYYPTAFFFSVQVFQPVLDQNFTKTVTDINGGDVFPGDVLEYTITYQNTGNDNATDAILTDDIPTNTTYEPDSLQIITDPDPTFTTPDAPSDAPNDDRAEFDSANNRVVFRTGVGAGILNGGVVPFDDPNVPGAVDDTVVVKFRVRVDSGISSFPTTISNQADIDYRGEFSGIPFSGMSDDPGTAAQSDPTDVIVSEPQDPNLLLVKRITRVNGTATNGSTDLAAYVEDADYPYDDNTLEPSLTGNAQFPTPDTENWPNTTGSTSSTFLIGGREGGTTRPDDEVEYTIYFLSTGDVDASDVELCDKVPDFQTFVSDAYNSVPAATGGGVGANRGILVEYNGSTLSYSNDDDGDTARFYPSGETLPSACDGAAAQTEDNGAIVVNLGNLPKANSSGDPATSYGLVRFRAKVK
ncbi:hypothetical protein C1752_13895 [Acaryochloris thomasi RCC1774]|uniref:DUF11 domain-containing protein n=1 Tax=Acaryochloris thomasi RCC1774 TaxID=1764569 RepID=A0A2W1J780_9CYAN|nr:DUF11 domain-containing protein [Acaryochloris thomasi]PZD70360.1 hypothetical protein C1752_13895 [Acaryochloris thomasi RCC1774]